ncbi:SCO family protein [Bacillus benzoevorans]|uniref:SCO family protein n=1 Tax=Bacillus benzoevorans TaxID=1456 RepID=UPI001620A881
MHKIYILCASIIVLGIAGGISFFVIRDVRATVPDDITLVTMHNEEYAFSKSEKKLKLVEFMYGHCPDICPTTTIRMNMLKKDLEKAGVFGDKVQFITVTIDPYRDTPEELMDYMKTFEIEDDGNWILLTGDPKNIKEDVVEIKELGETFQFQYRDPGDGFYVHSTFVFLLNENNRFIKKFEMGEGFNKEEVFETIMDKI